jgi:uncharacterized Zn-finger protein
MNKKNELLYDSDNDENIEEEQQEIIKNVYEPQLNNIIAPEIEITKPKLKRNITIKNVPKQEKWSDFINDDIEEANVIKIPPAKLFKCDYCNRSFVRNYHLNRHMDRCTVKHEIDRVKEIQYNENENNKKIKQQKKEKREANKLLKEQEQINIIAPKPIRANKPKEIIKPQELITRPKIQPPQLTPQHKYIIRF